MVEQIEKARNPDKVERDIKCPLCRSSIIDDANRVRSMHNKAPVHIPQHTQVRKSMYTFTVSQCRLRSNHKQLQYRHDMGSCCLCCRGL